MKLLIASVIGLLFVVGCDRNAPIPPSQQLPLGEATSGGMLEEFDGFEFEVPAGWKRVSPERTKTKAMILLNGSAWDNSDGMLKVDVGKPSLPTAQETARAFAGNDGVHISIDGQDAIRLSIAGADMSAPQQAVVVYRDERVYLLMASGTKNADITQAMDEVIKSWHWSPEP
jgi:hypothetical protein